jgi:hypothetical protein
MRRFFCALVLSLPWLCGAQLSGPFTYAFTTRPLLWDFSGTYAVNGGDLQIVNVLTNWPSGAISGTGFTDWDSFFSEFHAHTNVETGRVAVLRRRVTLDVRGKGPVTGRLFTHDYTGTFSERLRGFLDPTNRTVIASINNASCQPDRTCETLGTNVVFNLPANMDGTWSLALNLATSNKVITGTATVELSNGRLLNFAVKGATATRTLRLKGTNDTVRSTLTVNVSTNGQLRSLKGRLFGQSLAYP